MLPSGPAVIPVALASAVGIEYSVTTPPVVTFAILFALVRTIQIFPSGPLVIAWAPDAAAGRAYSVIVGCAERTDTPDGARTANSKR
jgi:hypothetical protein